jgi:hypothetical protein
VLNQVIDKVHAKDRDFQAWRTEHRESFGAASRKPLPPRTPPARTKPARPEDVTDLGLTGAVRR